MSPTNGKCCIRPLSVRCCLAAFLKNSPPRGSRVRYTASWICNKVFAHAVILLHYESYKIAPAYVSAFIQGLSTIGGFVFPFCTNRTSWCTTLAISFIFYFYILVRLRCKYARFGRVPTGKRLDQLEMYHRSVISLRLLVTCVVGWTFLITMFMAFSVIGPLFAPEDS
jgi:hypothetical protein